MAEAAWYNGDQFEIFTEIVDHYYVGMNRISWYAEGTSIQDNKNGSVMLNVIKGATITDVEVVTGKHTCGEEYIDSVRIKCKKEDELDYFFNEADATIYSYEMMDKMCNEIISIVDMLEHDFYNPSLDVVKAKIINKSDCGLHALISFYIRFVRIVRELMVKCPQNNLFSISGP